MAAPASTKSLARRPSTTLARRDDCTHCPTISPCRDCARGKSCQQIFRPSGDCNSCPTNVCVSDGSDDGDSGPATATIVGPVAATLGTITIAAILVYLWWRKRRVKAIAAAQARAQAKVRDANTRAFALKGGSRGAAAPVGVAAGAQEATSWTYPQADAIGEALEAPGVVPATTDHAGTRRQSAGAATHLSRITEGAEEDEWDGGHDLIVLHDSGPRQVSGRFPTAARASGARSSFSGLSSLLSRRSRSLRDPFEPEVSGGSGSGRHPPAANDSRPPPSTLPSQPVQALRLPGAPVSVLELQPSEHAPPRPSRNADLDLQLDAPVNGARSTYSGSISPNKQTHGRAQRSPMLSPDAQDTGNLSPSWRGRDAAADKDDARSHRSVSSALSGLSDLSYIYSSPQIMTVTASSSGGAQRDGASPSLHKAQLVRNLSDLRRNPSQSTVRQRQRSSFDADETGKDPFSDDNAAPTRQPLPCEGGSPFDDSQAVQIESGPRGSHAAFGTSGSDQEPIETLTAADGGKPTSRYAAGGVSMSPSSASTQIVETSSLTIPDGRFSTSSSDSGVGFRIPIVDLTQSQTNNGRNHGTASVSGEGLAKGQGTDNPRGFARQSGAASGAPGKSQPRRRQVSPSDVRVDEGDDGPDVVRDDNDEDQHPDRPPSNWTGSLTPIHDPNGSAALRSPQSGRTSFQMQVNRFTSSSLGGLSVLDGFDWNVPTTSTEDKTESGKPAVPALPPWITKRRDS
ncbi:unnamed protein product [Parajaminaea phylloscopi]